MSLTVVKVGGSLYDLPDLGPRLQRWLPTQDSSRILLVPGGGAAVDVVREFARLHRLSEEDAHWLALHAVTMNAHSWRAAAGTPIVGTRRTRRRVWRSWTAWPSRVPTRLGQSLPHTWR